MPASNALRERVEALKTSLWMPQGATGGRQAQGIQGAVQTTLTVLSSVYGAGSHEVRAFQGRITKGLSKDDDTFWLYERRVATDIESALDGALADLDAGVASNSGIKAKGEILGDFVMLAREALDLRSEEANRVAAVLAAAALEETLKQLGASAGVDVYGRDLRGVIEKLKQADLLSGPQFSLAHGLVPFRDKAMHAQFDQIALASTESALSFVQALLLSSFT